MHQYRAVLVRLRQGDSERDIARSRLMGRRKAARVRELAQQRGWLHAESALPEDAAIAEALGKLKRARTTISSLEPHRERIERYAAQGATITHLDGISVDFENWHFNVRPSNTEPLLRLNLEALGGEDEMIARRDEVLDLIRS